MLVRIYIVLGILGAIAMAIWAKRRGKPPLPYVILGAFAGPIVLALYLWFRKDPNTPKAPDDKPQS